MAAIDTIKSLHYNRPVSYNTMLSMAEFWYDTSEGALLVGAFAAEQRMQEVGQMVVPLAEVLTNPDYAVRAPEELKINSEGWDDDAKVAYGQWILQVVTAGTGDPTAVTRQVFRQARNLGLGPSPRSLDFNEFKDTIGVPLGNRSDRRAHRRFRDADEDDIIDAAIGYFKDSGHKISDNEYDQAAKTGSVPNLRRLSEALGGGGVSALNELLGYPNIPSWQEEDFIDYGVNFVKANGPEALTGTLNSILAELKYGPATRTIIERFGKWNIYKGKVLAKYQQIETTKQTRLAAYRQRIADGTFPAEYGALPEDELLAIGARYTLIEACAPQAIRKDKDKIARFKNIRFLFRDLGELSKHLTPGYIEMVALSLHILDQLYPTTENEDRLRIAPEQIEAARAARRGPRTRPVRKRYTDKRTKNPADPAPAAPKYFVKLSAQVEPLDLSTLY